MSFVRAAFSLGWMLLLAGCLSIDPAKKSPTPLAAEATQADLSVAVRGLVVIGGPGSWTTAAWDEYLVTFENRSTEPVRIESAELEDFLGVRVPAGSQAANIRTDYSLRSAANLHRYETAHVEVKRAEFPMRNSSLIAATLIGGYPIGFLLAPAVLPALEAEARKGCTARQVALPAELPARHASTGSLFFPVTAGPQRLIVQARRGAETLEVAVPLNQLANLHRAERK